MNPNGPGTYSGFTKVKNPLLGENLSALSGENFLGQLLPKTIGLLFVFGSVAFFFMLLWGAISWILSGGDKAHVENAKGRITNALLGFVLMIMTFGIITLVENFFGINILLIDIGPLVIQ